MTLSSGSLDPLATIIFFLWSFPCGEFPFFMSSLCLDVGKVHVSAWAFCSQTNHFLTQKIVLASRHWFRTSSGFDRCEPTPFQRKWRHWSLLKCVLADSGGCIQGYGAGRPPVGIRPRWHLLPLKYRSQEEAQHFQDVHWLLYGQGGPHWLWQMLDITFHPDCLWIYSRLRLC